MVHLVTGYYGYEHIKSADQRAFNAAFFGDGQNVLDFGNKFAASIIDNNTVRIADGEGMMFGGHFRIETNSCEDVTITTGTAGTNRIDLICVTYKKNETDGTEQTYLEVIKGTAANSPTIPAYTTGNLLEGAIFNQMPLYKVTISGVALTKVEPLFETIPTYKALAERYAQQFEDAVAENINNLATKNEVQTAQTKANNAVKKAGDIMTGFLTLHADPTANKHAATKQYVDNLTDMDLLWENANPTSNFGAQSISNSSFGDSDKYRLLAIFCGANEYCIVPNISGYESRLSNPVTSDYAYVSSRKFTVNKGSISFERGRSAKTGSASSYADDSVIPYLIYGIK